MVGVVFNQREYQREYHAEHVVATTTATTTTTAAAAVATTAAAEGAWTTVAHCPDHCPLPPGGWVNGWIHPTNAGD
jgi:hypothetical protein